MVPLYWANLKSEVFILGQQQTCGQNNLQIGDHRSKTVQQLLLLGNLNGHVTV